MGMTEEEMTVAPLCQGKRKPTNQTNAQKLKGRLRPRAGFVVAQYENTRMSIEIILGNQEKVIKDNASMSSCSSQNKICVLS